MEMIKNQNMDILLAEFREKSAFPYLIDLINKGEEYVEYIIGNDYQKMKPEWVWGYIEMVD